MVKEWLVNAFGEIFDPTNYYWIHTQGGLFPNFYSFVIPNYEKHFEIMGILMGLSVLEGFSLNLEISNPVLKFIY